MVCATMLPPYYTWAWVFFFSSFFFSLFSSFSLFFFATIFFLSVLCICVAHFIMSSTMCDCVFERPNEINIQRRTKDTPTTKYRSILLRCKRRDTQIQIETCVRGAHAVIRLRIPEVTIFLLLLLLGYTYTWAQCLVLDSVMQIVTKCWAVIVVPTVCSRCFPFDERRYQFSDVCAMACSLSFPMYSMTFFIRTK